MVLKMFTIYDRKSAIHQPPAYCHSVGHAMRVFMTVFRDPKSVFFQFPEDFQIFEVGSFDDRCAKLTPIGAPRLVCAGTELLEKKEIPFPIGGEVK